MHSTFALFAFLLSIISNAAIPEQFYIFDGNNPPVEPPKFVPGEPPRFIPEGSPKRAEPTAANEEQACIYGPKPRHDIDHCVDLGSGYWVKPYCQNGSSEFFPSTDGTQGWFCQFWQCYSMCAQKCSEHCIITSDYTVKTIFYECKLLASAAANKLPASVAANVCNDKICHLCWILVTISGILVGIFEAKMLIKFDCRRRHSRVVAQENVVAKPPAKNGIVYNF